MFWGNHALGSIKTHEEWMDSSTAHFVLLVMCESRVVTCGLIALLDTSDYLNFNQ